MKNLPESDLFDQLKTRLSNYTEEPDDTVWAGIVAGTNLAPGFSWVSFTAGFLSSGMIAVMLFISYKAVVTPSTPKLTTIAPIASPLSERNKPTAIKPAIAVNGNSTVMTNPAEAAVPYGHQANPLKKSMSVSITPGDVEGSGTLFKTGNSQVLSNFGALESEARLSGNENKIVVTDSIVAPKKNAKDSVEQRKDPVPDQKKKTRPMKPGLKYYAMISPSMSFEVVSPAANDQILVTKFMSPGILSANRFGFAFDVGIQGSISDRWEYFGSLSYYQQHQSLTYQYQSRDSVKVSAVPNSNDFIIEPGKTYQRQLDYSMKSLGLGGGFLYLLKGNKLTTKAGVGVSYSRNIETPGYQYLFGQVLYRNELSITKAMKLFLQPTFSYALLAPGISYAPVKLRPYRAGISFGVIYQFRTDHYVNSGVFQR